ncbi:hypothetical protein Acr_08g0012850 [Actinidia rufa]|uniref:Uncharacterized protein n=1 Tax=Actinidia rufa TaxID=165716 RepID=A0A7J0F3S2_9ERIC|nr:hypothetical protein Acr_08g0012850 [Actinidia rufa]
MYQSFEDHIDPLSCPGLEIDQVFLLLFELSLALGGVPVGNRIEHQVFPKPLSKSQSELVARHCQCLGALFDLIVHFPGIQSFDFSREWSLILSYDFPLLDASCANHQACRNLLAFVCRALAIDFIAQVPFSISLALSASKIGEKIEDRHRRWSYDCMGSSDLLSIWPATPCLRAQEYAWLDACRVNERVTDPAMPLQHGCSGGHSSMVVTAPSSGTEGFQAHSVTTIGRDLRLSKASCSMVFALSSGVRDHRARFVMAAYRRFLP